MNRALMRKLVQGKYFQSPCFFVTGKKGMKSGFQTSMALFLNWLVSQEGQELLGLSFLICSNPLTSQVQWENEGKCQSDSYVMNKRMPVILFVEDH